jgi:hypothetical protein
MLGNICFHTLGKLCWLQNSWVLLSSLSFSPAQLLSLPSGAECTGINCSTAQTYEHRPQRILGYTHNKMHSLPQTLWKDFLSEEQALFCVVIKNLGFSLMGLQSLRSGFLECLADRESTKGTAVSLHWGTTRHIITSTKSRLARSSHWLTHMHGVREHRHCSWQHLSCKVWIEPRYFSPSEPLDHF